MNMYRHLENISLIIVVCSGLLLAACNKESHIIGGDPIDAGQFANTSTYDMLKGNAAFDTLVQLIDAAGLKDVVNQDGVTFFAPHDISILSYLTLRTTVVQNIYGRDKRFALDSLVYYLTNNVKGTRDSLKLYMLNQRVTYDVMNSFGKSYVTQLPGDTAIISYEEVARDPNSTLGYTTSVSTVPKLVYFTQLWYRFVPTETTPVSKISNTIGVRTLVKTSGIRTRNGVVHALDPASHTLFFYGTKR